MPDRRSDLQRRTGHRQDLIADQERITRSLVEFCGLEWDSRCLRFHESGRRVDTASRDQVRRPLYGHSVARLKHYEQYIGALLSALGEQPGTTRDL